MFCMTQAENLWYDLSAQETLSVLEVDAEQGLDAAAAEARLHRYGRNVLGRPRPPIPLPSSSTSSGTS